MPPSRQQGAVLTNKEVRLPGGMTVKLEWADAAGPGEATEKAHKAILRLEAALDLAMEDLLRSRTNADYVAASLPGFRDRGELPSITEQANALGLVSKQLSLTKRKKTARHGPVSRAHNPIGVSVDSAQTAI
jgi:hypothetical protein